MKLYQVRQYAGDYTPVRTEVDTNNLLAYLHDDVRIEDETEGDAFPASSRKAWLIASLAEWRAIFGEQMLPEDETMMGLTLQMLSAAHPSIIAKSIVRRYDVSPHGDAPVGQWAIACCVDAALGRYVSAARGLHQSADVIAGCRLRSRPTVG